MRKLHKLLPFILFFFAFNVNAQFHLMGDSKEDYNVPAQLIYDDGTTEELFIDNKYTFSEPRYYLNFNNPPLMIKVSPTKKGDYTKKSVSDIKQINIKRKDYYLDFRLLKVYELDKNLNVDGSRFIYAFQTPLDLPTLDGYNVIDEYEDKLFFEMYGYHFIIKKLGPGVPINFLKNKNSDKSVFNYASNPFKYDKKLLQSFLFIENDNPNFVAHVKKILDKSKVENKDYKMRYNKYIDLNKDKFGTTFNSLFARFLALNDLYYELKE